MRNKYMLIGVVGIVVGVLLSSVVFVLAGNVDSPAAPGATNSYTAEDIYNRLDTGADGAQSTFTEPGAAPGTGTMHTLNETMAKAPAKDDTNGAATGEVATGKTFWGLNVAGGEWGLRTGTAAAGGGAGVPRTGQTTCYDAAGTERACAGTGEDGEHLKDVAWPNPRFTKHGDGTVTDNLTGLIWLKNANCWGTQTWANALTNANGLASGSCGLTDGSTAGQWRLPNVREMQSLAHYGVYNPAVPNTAGTGQWTGGNPFDNVQSSYYWSSATSADNTTYAWYVSLYNGYVGNYGKTSTSYVWPVRGGQ